MCIRDSKNILQRDQTLQTAIFIDDQRKMGVTLEEFAHLFIQRGGIGDEVGLHSHFDDIQCLHPAQIAAVTAPHQTVHFAQQVFGVDDTKDVFLITAIDRQA